MASIRYFVTDIDRSVEFYRDKLEFSVDMHNPGRFAALIRDDLTLYLSAPGRAVEEPLAVIRSLVGGTGS
jgi:catechol 2,3-dioxygenase-like lactoylglutathione lyase family enzyme